MVLFIICCCTAANVHIATMVTASTIAAIAAMFTFTQSNPGILLASAFTAPHFHPSVQRLPPTTSLAAGKGFGDKPTPKTKLSTMETTTAKPTSSSSSSSSSSTQNISSAVTVTTKEDNTGSKMLQQLRSREAEKRDAELRKLRELRETEALLAEDAGAAAIPERVAQRMGKRMLPFVGIPLLGSFASFIGFWYLATYKDMEFQPAVVATTSFVFLATGLLVGESYYFS